MSWISALMIMALIICPNGMMVINDEIIDFAANPPDVQINHTLVAEPAELIPDDMASYWNALGEKITVGLIDEIKEPPIAIDGDPLNHLILVVDDKDSTIISNYEAFSDLYHLYHIKKSISFSVLLIGGIIT